MPQWLLILLIGCMYQVKRTGPSTEPWGTQYTGPVWSGKTKDDWSSSNISKGMNGKTGVSGGKPHWSRHTQLGPKLESENVTKLPAKRGKQKQEKAETSKRAGVAWRDMREREGASGNQEQPNWLLTKIVKTRWRSGMSQPNSAVTQTFSSSFLIRVILLLLVWALNRPDMTSVVYWALKIQYLSIWS